MDDSNEFQNHEADDVFRTAILFESSLGIIALILGWILGPDARDLVPEINLNQWGWEHWQPVLSGVSWGAFAAIPMLIFIALVRRLPFAAIRELEELSNDGMLSTLLTLRPAELGLISLCAGIGEELLFRGWLMQWLAGAPDEFGPIELGIGLIGSSVLFGLVHPITKLYVVIAALMGFYFGCLLIFTGNLLVPIVAHALYDAVQLILTSREQKQP